MNYIAHAPVPFSTPKAHANGWSGARIQRWKEVARAGSHSLAYVGGGLPWAEVKGR